MDGEDIEKRNFFITLGTLSGLGVIIAIIKTWKWFSRSGKGIIDLPTMIKFLFYIFGIISTIFLLVIAGFTLSWLIRFKRNYTSTVVANSSTIQNLFRIFLIISFIFKTFDIIHLIIRQTRIDIFFMDWERSRTGDSNSISIWRTYFVANEFNEIQTFRRINVPLQLFFVLFFLKVINFENITCTESNIQLGISADNCTEYNKGFRIAIGFSTLLGTALIQYLVYIIIYQRMIAHKIVNFIDLCSVSNISVFILDQYYHGYYIHGRSPHGITDVNMKDILMNFHREEHHMSGKRGLQEHSDEQTFIMKITPNFRKQYESLFRNYYEYTGPRRTREDAENYTDVLLHSYQNLNSFLCRFIDHSLVSHQYFIRNRFLLEKVLNYEFHVRATTNPAGHISNSLYIDNEKSFTEILFYGEERSLLIWNMITFIFIDYLATNYVLAAIITYILNSIIVGIRNSFGRKNLSKKTLIPRNFLI